MGSRVCPYCQGLNGEAERRCYRCGRRLPGELGTAVQGLVRDVLGADAPVTKLVITMELVVFGLCSIIDRRLPVGLGFFPLPWPDYFEVSTLVRFGALVRSIAGEEPWRLLSSGFVHASLLHIGMNMAMFASLGAQLERHFGAARSVVVFVGAIIAGALASAWWYRGGLMVGASGGVFGQIGAFVGLLLANRDPAWKKMAGRAVVYALLITLAIPGVDTAAHLGGFVGGIGLGFVLQKEMFRLRLHRAAVVLAALLLFGAVASVGLSSVSPVWKHLRSRELLGE
jgi:rhomboid protease GluP